MQGGWTPPRHHAVLDDHLTKLYATAESQLQSYVAALAERKRKAALLSDGKKMETGHPCVNFVFANNDGTMFCKNVDTFGHSKTAEWYAAEIKAIIEETGRSVSLVLLDSAGECVKWQIRFIPPHTCLLGPATPDYSAPPALWRQRPRAWSDHTEAVQSPRGQVLQCQCAAAGTETVVGPCVPQSTPVLGIRN